jgi:hypothetical protein
MEATMASNYNTFQAVSDQAVFVLQDLALWVLPVDPTSFNFVIPFKLDEPVVNFVALPGAISGPNFTGPVLVSSTNGDLWAEFGPFDSLAKPPPPRFLVDGTVSVLPAPFQTPPGQIDEQFKIFVLGLDGNLWLEHGPYGAPPPARVQVDANVVAFQPLSDSEVLVLGSDGNLWLEHGPFGQQVPPVRQQVDGNVFIPAPVASGQIPVVCSFQALSDTEVFVLGFDGNLWLEHGPFGQQIPPIRQQVDGNVLAFQALSDTEAFVLGTDGNLWLEHGPFGQVPPPREQVDGNVVAFQALSDTEVFVLGFDGNLWLESGPFGQQVPPPRVLAANNVRLPVIL